MHRYEALATSELGKRKICGTFMSIDLKDLISIAFPGLMHAISHKRKAAPVCSGAAFLMRSIVEISLSGGLSDWKPWRQSV
jgi:hypothetical protein